MFEDNRNRILAGLLTAVGAALAFFGIRWVIGRVQQNAHDEEYQQRARQRLQVQSGKAIGEFGQDAGAGQTGEGLRYTPAGSNQPQDQPDRAPIPTTGMEAVSLVSADDMEEMVEEHAPVDLDQQVNPLVQYLLTFADMITVLRDRRDEGSDGDRSLTTEDRSYFQGMLDRLAPSLEGYAEGNVEENSLQDRIYRLTVKVRGALQNLEYTDDDLFRINGEVRSEACHLLREIQGAGASSGDDFDRVVEAYEC